MKLKQATTQVVDFGQVLPLGTFADANTHMNGERPWDIVFVSTRFENDAISQFITNAKNTKCGQDTAYVMVMKALPQGNTSVAQNMMLGGDSVLCEPYSVDSMVEITRLAARVKKERSDSREKIAINLLIADIVNQVDVIACLKASGCEPGTSIKKLREMNAMIKALSEDKLGYYQATLIEKLLEAKVPPKALLGAKRYGGVSSRVKKKMESKILSELTKADKPPA